MGKIIVSMVLLVMTCHVLFASLQDEAYTRQNDREKIVQFSNSLEALRKELKIPGLSAAIVQNDHVLWSAGFGYADIEKKIPATPDTAYHLASLTKPFTSIIIMQLVEQGKLDLNTPVSHFGIRGGNIKAVTVRHLLSHTSEGIPGTVYRYNGDRYIFLGQVIERITGKSYKQVLIENILKPLNMTSTAPNQTGKKDNKQTIPYALDSRGQISKGFNYTSFNASAGLISTVLDMAKFDIAISENKLLKPETRELAFTPFVSNTGKNLPYGFGWFTQAYNQVRLIWHYGYYSPSISTLILKAPDQRLTLILMANTDGLSRPFSLGAGDVLTSPFATLFYRVFIYPGLTGKTILPIDWKSDPKILIAQLLRIDDTQDREWHKKDLVAYWNMYKALGQKEVAKRLFDVYTQCYSKKKPPGFQDFIKIAEIDGVGDNDYRIVEFILEHETPVWIYGIGEGGPTKMLDFGGIEDTKTRKPVWLMDYKETDHAGGTDFNRLVKKSIVLPKGRYRLHFKTDESHSLARWVNFPPDDSYWGISLYRERYPGTGATINPLVIPANTITTSERLLDSAVTGQSIEVMVQPILKTIMIVLGVFFLLSIILLSIVSIINRIKKRKSTVEELLAKKSKLSIVGTIAMILNGLLGLFYVLIAVYRRALEYLLMNGFDDSGSFEVKVFFLFIPLAIFFITIFQSGYTFFVWKKKYRTPFERWFYVIFTIVSVLFVLVCLHNYMLLFGSV